MTQRPFVWLAAFALSAGPAFGALIERDWLAPGDGLLTFDPSTQLEWLDVTVTELVQYGEPTIDDAIDRALAEAAPGGRFEGFSLATAEQALALAEGLGVMTGPANIPESRANGPGLTVLMSFLGSAIEDPNVDGFAGVLSDPNPNVGLGPPGRFASRLAADAVLAGPRTSAPDGSGIFTVTGSSDIYTLENAAMLFVRLVPEPTAFATCAMASAVMLSTRVRPTHRSRSR